MVRFLSKSRVLVILVSLAVLGGIAWWQRAPLLARYYVWQLSQASEASRESLVARVISLDEHAVPTLVERLAGADAKTGASLERALIGMAQKWGTSDGRSAQLLAYLLGRYESTKSAALLLCSLHLATTIGGSGIDESRLEHYRTLAATALRATDADTRIAAVQLILRTSLRQDANLTSKVVPLLKDRAAAVRKAAVIALGPARAAVTDDELLMLLHDPDDEVQSLCELALQSRGLTESHILLARLISDERPSARLQVLQHLREASDLDLGVWLGRLSQDPSPAVRAAAIRAAAGQSEVDLRARLNEMAQQDPSPTVRQLAGHYLSRTRVALGE